jgi:Uma2 family endonuclease
MSELGLIEYPKTNSREISPDRSMPSLNHSFLCLKLIQALLKNDSILPLPDLTLDIANGLTPDISVFLKHTIHPNFFQDVIRFPERPLLAIEVISSSQTIQEMLDKARLLVKEGVKTVWTVEPFTETVFVTTETEERRFHRDIVRCGDIEVDFNKVFVESDA